MEVNVLVLAGEGINCEVETSQAFELAGARPQIVHIQDFLEFETLDDYDILAFPGGFSFGDEIRSGKILSEQIKRKQSKNILKFINSDKKPVIGICNGFQILVQLGLFNTNSKSSITLSENTHEKFLNDWVSVTVEKNHCLWLKDISSLYLPIRNKEGLLSGALENNEQISLRYDHPYNGKNHNIAGITNIHGNVLGLMPHPEAAQYPFLMPQNKDLHINNRKIFSNSVEYIRRMQNA